MQGINCASRDSPRLFPQGYVSVTPETPSTTKSNGTSCEIPISYSQNAVWHREDRYEYDKKQVLCSSCVCNVHVRQGGTLCRAWGYHMAIKLEGDKGHGANICRDYDSLSNIIFDLFKQELKKIRRELSKTNEITVYKSNIPRTLHYLHTLRRKDERPLKSSWWSTNSRQAESKRVEVLNFKPALMRLKHNENVV
ncbi:hypothetical protein V1477_016330 [Vespula maculifrons]|uniref:Uncharacterized protein n=1 Tax=Vespula maculifrons TaxID=7453 RepID=A0ABD2BCQ9_VESMC